MDPLAVGALVALAVATFLAAVVAVRRGRELDAVRVELKADRGSDLDRRARATVAAAARADARAVGAEADLARVLDLVGAGVVRLDRDARVGLANADAHRLLARGPGVMLDRSVLEAFVDHRIEPIVGEAGERGEATGELGAGTTASPRLLVRARRIDEATWIVLTDVTELRHLQRVRAEFVDNLSHELRTPVTTLSLLAETLARDTDDLPRRTRDRIAKIEVEASHLAQMVNELLDLARIEGSAEVLALHDVDLAGVVRTSAERLRPAADRAGVRLVLDVPDALDPVRGDEERLGQVVVNLVHNAVKFSEPGGTVAVTVRTSDDEVVTSVADDGAGIPATDLERVFERFYKVDRARGAPGTGLGLAIARHVVDAHGGRIWAESEEGRGATVRFALPRRQPPSVLST